MKKSLFLLSLATCICSLGFSQLQRAFTPRYYNPSVRGNIVYVANNIITSPLRNNAENPPGGTAVNDTTVATYIDAAPLTQIIPWNSTWKFCDSGYAPGAGGTAWRNAAYNDAAWSSATANTPASPARDIGYGDLDEVAPYVYASCGGRPGNQMPNCGSKYWTTYFRQKVTIPNVANYSGFQINLHRDDGAVVYVNGIEVFRSNMPAGTIFYSTPASSGVEGATEDVTINLPPAAFSNGVNQIAVEVHQYLISNTVDGNDLSFRMELLADETFSSSTADLNLPSCSQVLFAGLYWGAATNDIIGPTQSNMAWITGETNVKLRIPGALSYTTVTSTQTDYHNLPLVYGRNATGYRAFANITALLNTSNPNGTYSIANIVGPNNLQNGSGGWTIVIAYANSALQPRNLTVMDGSAIVNGGDPALTIGLSGFLTPPSGPVSCELGAIVYDGDRGSPDEFSFKQDSNRLVGTYTNLTPNATSTLNDMWNSTISYKGSIVMTRNPAHLNTLGYDADIIDVPNAGNVVLGNNKTTASIHFSSTFENYFIQCFTTSIAVYSPSYSFDKAATDLSGGTVTPGDSLRYQINYNNVGNDASINTTIVDNIPLGTTYKPGTIKINGVAKTDAAGDDEAEYDLVNNKINFRVGTGATAATGGNVAFSTAGNVQFDVVLASSCAMVACVNPVKNSARISYTGQSNALNQSDSSGVNSAGCVTQSALSTTLVGSCVTINDTIIVNKCPVTTVTIPWRRYAGYTIYSAKPFIPANIYNPATPVSLSHIYWAYFTAGGGCADTIKITVFIVACPDIDDDNDGIPDYVEINNPLALQDHNGNGIPNWKDPAYPGYVDNNADGYNDNFDPAADSDNDGILNFYDTDFPGYIDTNGDHINDKMDKDLDGIPNNLDLDSDNDGIPDVVESYGVDTNGDGIIDNYTDTDNDGFSQNVDANNTGVGGSGNGLDAQDLDGDGIPNYLDLDSDNDGIPDIIEALGTDVNNDGMVDVFTDVDGDGLTDNLDGDVGNDNIAENSANALLRTGPDTTPMNGRADNYPFKNFDNDGRANPYDLDSDMDGIVDVLEAGFTDVNFDGLIDGPVGTDGWNIAVNAKPSLGLLNTDSRGNPDYLDIDSDDDGIPDNIEGQTTASYKLPTYVDTDNDGIDNAYDNVATFSGRGVFIADKDMDGIPDYRDLDTDADGKPDIIEGNDFNLNTWADDNVTLTLLDTDSDGLDNRFDSLNSTTNIRGTSYRMGNNGSFAGDPTPGTRSVVQQSMTPQSDRDWRSAGYVLNVDLLEFTAFAEEYNNTILSWSLITSDQLNRFEIERSIDNIIFTKVSTLVKNVELNQTQDFKTNDDITDVYSSIIYYRLKIIGANGLVKYSEVRAVRKNGKKAIVNIFPNPASSRVTIQVYTEKEGEGSIRIIDNSGRIVSTHKQKLVKGMNTVVLSDLSQYSNGIYNFQCLVETDVIIKKINIQNK